MSRSPTLPAGLCPWPFAVLAGVALVFAAGLFTCIAVAHIRYPGFTEPMEGDVLQHIERLIEGQPLYPAPSGEFIPLAYMPLYYMLAAPFYSAFGDSFIGPRLLSCLCAAACGVLIGRIAGRETGSRTLACLATAVYLAGYQAMDAYLTCAMPDALFLLWLLLGYWFFAYGRTRLHDVLFLVFFALAFWTKQHGALFFGFAVLYALLFRTNALPRWSLVLGLILGGPVAYLLIGPHLGERFFYSTFVMPGRWEHNAWYSLRRTSFLLVYVAPIVSLLSLLYLRTAVDLGKRRVKPLAWFTVTTLAATLFTMTAAGSSNNHYIPLLAIMAVTAVLGVQRVLSADRLVGVAMGLFVLTALASAAALVGMHLFPTHAITSYVPICLAVVALAFLVVRLAAQRDETRTSVFPGATSAAVLLLGQFAVTAYHPSNYLPSADYAERLVELRAELGKLDAPVIWVPYGNVPTAFSGTKLARAPSWVALEDIARQRNAPEEVAADLEPFRRRILSMHKLYVLSDDRITQVPVWAWLAPNLELVRDFDQQFAELPEIVDHWYGGHNYPRYLYRYSPKRVGEVAHVAE